MSRHGMHLGRGVVGRLFAGQVAALGVKRTQRDALTLTALVNALVERVTAMCPSAPTEGLRPLLHPN